MVIPDEDRHHVGQQVILRQLQLKVPNQKLQRYHLHQFGLRMNGKWNGSRRTI
jgi:hypothetical protein